jgi:apolipoprotein N-acyltransferase
VSISLILCPFIAVIVSAALYTVALPDLGWWPAAFVAWTPLLVVLPNLRKRSAFFAGWALGTLSHLGIFPWISHTAQTMSNFSPAAGAVILVLFALLHGLAWGVTVLGIRTLSEGKQGIGYVVTTAAIVSAVEFVNPQLFPWHLGNVFWRVPILMQGVEITGIAGATFVAVAFGAALAAILKRGGGAVRGAVFAVAILVVWVAYGVVRFGQVEKEVSQAPTARLALVQPDVTAADRLEKGFEAKVHVIEKEIATTRSGDLEEVEAIIWPEGAFPTTFPTNLQGQAIVSQRVAMTLLRHIRGALRTFDKPLILGSVTKPDAETVHNSAIMISPKGSIERQYHKRRLLAFGEYMPFSDLFPGLKGLVPRVTDMTPGSHAEVFELGPAKAMMSICYEAIHPEFTRQAALSGGGNMILNLTNDGWFGDYGAPGQHLMVQAPRAVELRTSLVRVTQTGITAVISPSGKIIVETGIHEKRTVTVDVPLKEPKSFYLSFGPVFAWLCVLLALSMVISRISTLVKRRRGLEPSV